jgi:hypothetical protein
MKELFFWLRGNASASQISITFSVAHPHKYTISATANHTRRTHVTRCFRLCLHTFTPVGVYLASRCHLQNLNFKRLFSFSEKREILLLLIYKLFFGLAEILNTLINSFNANKQQKCITVVVLPSALRVVCLLTSFDGIVRLLFGC